ncbi:MAG: PEP-CTERM sorting domain-containing protein, partial [Alphaproteobacteria bacterium]
LAFAIGAVPEPGSWALMIVGIGVIGGGMRRRRATRAPA